MDQEIDFDEESSPSEAVGSGSGIPLPKAETSPTNCPPSAPSDSGDGQEPEQMQLLHVPEFWEESWAGMPAYKQESAQPFKSIYVHFETRKDMADFAKLIGQTIGLQTQYVWYPEAELDLVAHKAWVDAPKPAMVGADDLIETVED
jgi:hypothetical protein